MCRHYDQPGITVPTRGHMTYRSRLAIQKGDVARRQTADSPPAQEIAAHPCPNPQTPGNIACTIHSKGPLHDYFTITYNRCLCVCRNRVTVMSQFCSFLCLLSSRDTGPVGISGHFLGPFTPMVITCLLSK